MVIYYSWSGKTKTYAESLAGLRGDSLFALNETKPRRGILGFVTGCFQSIAKKETPVDQLPSLSKEDTIYLCSPIWAGSIAPAVRYFLNHGGVKNKTVHFLLTCGDIGGAENFKKNALQALEGLGCTAGEAYVFACPAKQAVDVSIAQEHLRKMILGKETE